jgi:hypothetical protein
MRPAAEAKVRRIAQQLSKSITQIVLKSSLLAILARIEESCVVRTQLICTGTSTSSTRRDRGQE